LNKFLPLEHPNRFRIGTIKVGPPTELPSLWEVHPQSYLLYGRSTHRVTFSMGGPPTELPSLWDMRVQAGSLLIACPGKL